MANIIYQKAANMLSWFSYRAKPNSLNATQDGFLMNAGAVQVEALGQFNLSNLNKVSGQLFSFTQSTNGTEDFTFSTSGVDARRVLSFFSKGNMKGLYDFLLSGNDTITGTNNADILDGKKGADTMIGGAGADLYMVDHAGDICTDIVDTNEYDMIKPSVDYNMSSNADYVDDIELTGRARVAVGNDLDNLMIGNNRNNILNGGTGSDQIYGNAGNDIITGGAGADSMFGGKGKDTFIFNYADAAYDANANDVNVDDIYDFSVRERDVLDIRDLLNGESKNDINGLLKFIVATKTSEVMSDGSTLQGVNLQISKEGTFSVGDDRTSGATVDLEINVFGTDFMGAKSEYQLIADWLQAKTLLVD